VVGEWERVVSTIKFLNGVPPEVWGTGLSPSEWRTQNPADLKDLRLAAISNFNRVKRKEYAVCSSTHIAAREDIWLRDICMGVFYHYSINFRRGRPAVLRLRDGYDPPIACSAARLRHQHVPEPLPSPMHPVGRPPRWPHSLERPSTNELCGISTPPRYFNIPCVEDNDRLLALRSALNHSPSRAAVHADLYPLLHAAPSFEKFAVIVMSKLGNSSGGFRTSIQASPALEARNGFGSV